MKELEGLLTTPGGHEDQRRKITDISPRVKHFKIYQTIPLGNHFHGKTKETFHVTKGEFEIKFENTTSSGRETYIVREGETVNVPLYVAHKVIAKPGTEFINVCNIDFDGSDIHPYNIDW
jgi:mannose-6-phosphate isomerase-like protein (cupin superfamily)